jgi:hypothetical protein
MKRLFYFGIIAVLICAALLDVGVKGMDARQVVVMRDMDIN